MCPAWVVNTFVFSILTECLTISKKQHKQNWQISCYICIKFVVQSTVFTWTPLERTGKTSKLKFSTCKDLDSVFFFFLCSSLSLNFDCSDSYEIQGSHTSEKSESVNCYISFQGVTHTEWFWVNDELSLDTNRGLLLSQALYSDMLQRSCESLTKWVR